MASDIAELNFMAQKDENVETTIEPIVPEEAEEDKAESETFIEEPKEETPAETRGSTVK